LWFTYGKDGKHYVETLDGERHFLPKAQVDFEYTNGVNVANMVEDNYLEFRHEGGTKFVRTNDKHMTKTRRIDKDRMRELEPHIKSLWEWANTIAPVLVFNIETRTQYCDQMKVYYYHFPNATPKEEVVDILQNEEHEHRLAFAYICLSILFDKVDNKIVIPSNGYSQFRKLMIKATQSYMHELK
jgi:hypothetical protein